jgi:hypothetical protein
VVPLHSAEPTALRENLEMIWFFAQYGVAAILLVWAVVVAAVKGGLHP